MDSLAERLRGLTHNKYFAYIAVIFFAFLIALIFAVFALQPSLSPTPDDIRSSVTGDENGGIGTSVTGIGGIGGTGTTKTTTVTQAPQLTTQKPSVFERIVSVFTGKPLPYQTGSGTTQNTGGMQVSEARKRTEAMQKVFRDAKKTPAISIESHVLVTDLPATPTSMKAYQLQNSFSDLDVSELAINLGFTSIDAVEKRDSFSLLYDLGNKQHLGFDGETGSFNYVSEIGFTPSRSEGTPLQTAKTVLADIGYDDPTIRPYATYKRSDAPDFIFVELHRDWALTGAPILNPIGMLNLTQVERLDKLSISAQPDNTLVNAQIFATSDNTNGLNRPDSFNTATVKLSLTDGKVYAVSSNIPKIIATETLGADSLKTPIEAYNEYTKGQTTFGLTGPSGEGSVNLADVYSNDTAASSRVDVTDFELIYAASQTSTPDWWCPAYAFRSFGKIQTGFDVQFSHTVSASRDPRCQTAVLGETSTRELAQNTAPTIAPPVPTTIVGTNDASSLQYGTLGFQFTTFADTPTSVCADFNHSYLFKKTKDYSDYIAWVDRNSPQRAGQKQTGQGIVNFIPRDWYYVRAVEPGGQPSLATLNPSYNGGQLAQYRATALAKSLIGDPKLMPLDPKLASLEVVTCWKIVTASPWIHAYADNETELSVSINPVGGVAYVNPRFSYSDKATWDVTTGQNGQLALKDGLNIDGLFWEYYRNDVNAAYATYSKTHGTTNDGFVVATTQLPAFLEGLSARIGLNTIETKHIIAELNRPSMQFTTPYVKVRFAPRGFLEKYLPLTISPQPDSMNRIYFELSPLKTFEKMQQPALPNLSRDGLAIVETGFIVLK